MDYSNDPARRRLVSQLSSARTLAEALAATEVLKQWRRQHPDDLGILDGGEILSHFIDFEEWKLANPAEWAAEQEAERRAITLHQPERDRILRQARSARTSAQLDRAERELFLWAADHPEDVGRELGILEALTDVLTRQEALEAQGTPSLVGQAA